MGPVNIAEKVIPHNLLAAVDNVDFDHILLVEREIVTGCLDGNCIPGCD